MRLALVVVTAVTSACSAGFRTSSGGALAPGSATNGRTDELVFSDEGGLLSRAGLALLGVASAAGSVQDVHTTQSSNVVGDTVVTETTTTGTVNPSVAQGSVGIISAATDSNQSLRGDKYALASRLEIASTQLGGDTWGWRYELGLAFRFLLRDGRTLQGLRGTTSLGFGNLHMKRRDAADPTTAAHQWDNGFFGLPTRVGYMFGRMAAKQPSSSLLRMDYAVEAFLKSDLNLLAIGDATSPTELGVRASLDFFYVESGLSLTGFGSGDRSLVIEAGLSF